MTIARCPACNDEVRLPQGISEDATLRCPLCLETVVAKQMLNGLPPEMELIEDPSPPLPAHVQYGSSANHDASTQAGGLTSKSDEIVISTAMHHEGYDMAQSDGVEVEVEVDDQPAAFEFEEYEAPQADAPSFGSQGVGQNSTRRRKSQGSGTLIMMASVVFGGLAAFPLAQLCLWWLFAKDPVQLGPKVSNIVPFVVPAQFRGKNDDDNREQSSDRRGGSRRLLNEDDPSPFADSGASHNRSANNDDSTSQTNNDQSTDDSNDLDSSQSGGPLSVNNPGVGSEYNRSPSDVLEDSQGLDPLYLGLASPSEQLRSIRRTEADDIYNMVSTLMEGFGQWDEPETLTNDEHTALLDRIYNDLCRLGQLLVYVDPEDSRSESASNNVHATMVERLSGESLPRFIANRAARRLQQPADLVGEGIVLSGSLLTLVREDDYLVSTIRLADTGRTVVRVYGWVPPPKSYVEGTNVTIFGSRIMEPERILGIEGATTELLAAGYVIIHP